MDGAGTPVGHEAFRCAAGPAGWRWFSEIETSVPEPHREVVDFVTTHGWRPLRLRIDTGSHALEAEVRGERLVGRRDDDPVDLPFGDETELDYLSPVFNAVTANRLGRTAEIDVVFLDPVTIEPRPVRQRYELLGEDAVETPVGTFDARRWRYTALPSGWSRELWVAGDIVVEYRDVFELAEYEPGRGPIPR
jgi:hypothetical protein